MTNLMSNDLNVTNVKCVFQSITNYKDIKAFMMKIGKSFSVMIVAKNSLIFIKQEDIKILFIVNPNDL